MVFSFWLVRFGKEVVESKVGAGAAGGRCGAEAWKGAPLATSSGLDFTAPRVALDALPVNNMVGPVRRLVVGVAPGWVKSVPTSLAGNVGAKMEVGAINIGSVAVPAVEVTAVVAVGDEHNRSAGNYDGSRAVVNDSTVMVDRTRAYTRTAEGVAARIIFTTPVDAYRDITGIVSQWVAITAGDT